MHISQDISQDISLLLHVLTIIDVLIISARYISVGAYDQDIDEQVVCKLENYTDLQLVVIAEINFHVIKFRG